MPASEKRPPRPWGEDPGFAPAVRAARAAHPFWNEAAFLVAADWLTTWPATPRGVELAAATLLSEEDPRLGPVPAAVRAEAAALFDAIAPVPPPSAFDEEDEDAEDDDGSDGGAAPAAPACLADLPTWGEVAAEVAARAAAQGNATLVENLARVGGITLGRFRAHGGFWCNLPADAELTPDGRWLDAANVFCLCDALAVADDVNALLGRADAAG